MTAALRQSLTHPAHMPENRCCMSDSYQGVSCRPSAPTLLVHVAARTRRPTSACIGCLPQHPCVPCPSKCICSMAGFKSTAAATMRGSHLGFLPRQARTHSCHPLAAPDAWLTANLAGQYTQAGFCAGPAGLLLSPWPACPSSEQQWGSAPQLGAASRARLPRSPPPH